MSKDKVGILTQYYKSHNYGGLLQSYALVKVISKMGYLVEQISYDTAGENYQENLAEKEIQEKPKKSLTRMLKKKLYHIANLMIKKDIQNRFIKMEYFGNQIPHSTYVFKRDDLVNTQKFYHTYVVGSDQVWNPRFYSPSYFCDFVIDGSKCIAYAASVSQNYLTNKQKKIYKDNLKNFSAISLRENNIDLIQELTDLSVQWVLDPTLLLERSDWDSICTRRCYDRPYIFCYFLGRDKVERKRAKIFAKKKKMKIITIPHLSGSYNLTDCNFGDIKMTSASPEDFLSLIKYAEYVFTDSFHAVVFSHIFQRNFFVFQRIGALGMSTRISSLLEIFGTENRFCDSVEKQTIEYLLNLPEIDFATSSMKFIEMKKKSFEFLKKTLNN